MEASFAFRQLFFRDFQIHGCIIGCIIIYYIISYIIVIIHPKKVKVKCDYVGCKQSFNSTEAMVSHKRTMHHKKIDLPTHCPGVGKKICNGVLQKATIYKMRLYKGKLVNNSSWEKYKTPKDIKDEDNDKEAWCWITRCSLCPLTRKYNGNDTKPYR
eukprot:444609_1